MTNIDKLNESINRIRDLLKDNPAIGLNLYVNPHIWQRLLTETSGLTLMGKNMNISQYYGFMVICDPEIPDNEFILCTTEDFAIYKAIKDYPILRGIKDFTVVIAAVKAYKQLRKDNDDLLFKPFDKW